MEVKTENKITAAAKPDDYSIRVENLTKIYKLYDKPIDRLKESLSPFKKKHHKDFYALNGISFDVKRGETIGIIGKNGSGKSTLLKIITGVLTASGGNVHVNGRISALLELGIGFNPEFSGMENIYLSGTIFGIKKEDMDKKVDDILDFADIGDFIHQPVRLYSSGMFARLAFAVAINIDPDILIVDEALAVGDMKFVQKCIRKFHEFKEQNKTILLVSHDIGSIMNFCDKAVWLIDGNIKMIGDPEDIANEYMSFMTYDEESVLEEAEEVDDVECEVGSDTCIQWEDASNYAFFGEGGARINKIALYSEESNKSLRSIKGGEEVVLAFETKMIKEIKAPIFGFLLKDRYGNQVLSVNNLLYQNNFKLQKAGDTALFKFSFAFPLLKNGEYSFTVAVAEGTLLNHVQHHWINDVLQIRVDNSDRLHKSAGLLLLEDIKMECE
ncbi:ABC transporter ATP-binding protein [Thermodesulfobacteriota bacterium]